MLYQSVTRRPAAIGIFCLLAVLSGCKNGVGSSIFSREQPPSQQILTHFVEKGETLYSISWRYNLEWQELAIANGILPPYTIYPGQLIKLYPRSEVNLPAQPDPIPSTDATAQVVVTPIPVPQVVVNPPIAAPNPSVPTVSSTQVAAPVIIPATVKPSPPPISSKPTTPLPTTVSQWLWPVESPIVKSFGSNGGIHKGITLATKLGQPVRAAATGDVVYSGSGLRGFGNLIILKHNDLYLSAYAHNSKLNVEEGDRVAAGQIIAEAGQDTEGLERLYFEIRKDGVPVDPLPYIGRR